MIGPPVSPTIQNKLSGIVRLVACYWSHPHHPLLHLHPRPLSVTVPPSLSLSICPPPNLWCYLSKKKTSMIELVPLRPSGLVLWCLLSPFPCPLPLKHASIGSADALAISSQDVQLHKRMDITVCNFLHDYDAHCRAANQLCLRLDQVAEEYRYHKQAREHMIDTANWTGYPACSIPIINKEHSQEPPPTIMSHVKWGRLV